VLWRTQQLLEAHKLIHFPAAYRDWIEKVYERDDWDDEPESISFDYDKFHFEEKAKQDKAKMLSNDTMNPLGDSDKNVRALTRDGEMSLSVVLLDADGKLLYDPYPLPKPDDWDHAEKISLGSVGVPNSWQGKLKGIPMDEQGNFLLTMIQRDNQGWIGQAHEVTLRYSQIVGLEKIESEGA
jgi:CRISPR-associated endonuclease/helicase Cas3